MTKQEMLDRLFAVETALCDARVELEDIASDCHWNGPDTPEGEDFWIDCADAIQSHADLVAVVEDWIFQIKEGDTTIEEAIAE